MGFFSSDKKYPVPPDPTGQPPAGNPPPPASYTEQSPPGYHQATSSISSSFAPPSGSSSSGAYGVGVGYTASGYPDEKKQPLEASTSAPSMPIYACMLLSSSDKLRLLNFPHAVWDAIEQTIIRAWIGIQRKKMMDNTCIEFKLRGNPWYGQYSEAVPSRRLMTHLLHCLSVHGWHLSISTDLSKKSYDKDTLFFRQGPPLNRMYFSVSFNEFDKIRIIDPPTEQIKNAFMQAVQTWPLGIQRTETKEHGCTQLKLRGNPWMTSDGVEVNQARLLAMTIMTVMDQHGYELAGSVDMSASGGEGTSDLDTWFFASKIH